MPDPTAAHGGRSAQRNVELATFAVAAAVGLASSPLVGIYTLVLAVPVGAVAWLLSRTRPEGPAQLVVSAAAGLVAGVAVYFLAALLVNAFGGAPGSGSGSG